MLPQGSNMELVISDCHQYTATGDLCNWTIPRCLDDVAVKLSGSLIAEPAATFPLRYERNKKRTPIVSLTGVL